MPAVSHRLRSAPRAADTGLEQARALVLDTVRPLPPEPVALADSLGRVLARDVVARRPLPAFENSAMDGYAVRAADVSSVPARLRLVGESRAGRPADAALGEGEAIVISTGAELPRDADAVVRVERTRREDDAPVVDVLDAVEPWADVRRAGEDVPVAAIGLRRGQRIGPAQLGLLAALRCVEPRCARVPRVSLLLTGDELRDPDEPCRRGGVVDVGSWTLPALAQARGARVVRRERVGDDPDAIRAALVAAAPNADLVVTCGGVSVGAHDHVRGCLAALGAHERFWGLALKPGHPTWFGTLGGCGVPVLGLPGNPVSAMVVFALLAGPALRAMRGEPELACQTALLDGGWRKPAGRAQALCCALRAGADGWHAQPAAKQGSHVLSSMAAADALAIVPAEATDLPDGTRVPVEPLARCW